MSLADSFLLLFLKKVLQDLAEGRGVPLRLLPETGDEALGSFSQGTPVFCQDLGAAGRLLEQCVVGDDRTVRLRKVFDRALNNGDMSVSLLNLSLPEKLT
jgi:hypothetical protein